MQIFLLVKKNTFNTVKSGSIFNTTHSTLCSACPSGFSLLRERLAYPFLHLSYVSVFFPGHWPRCRPSIWWFRMTSWIAPRLIPYVSVMFRWDSYRWKSWTIIFRTTCVEIFFLPIFRELRHTSLSTESWPNSFDYYVCVVSEENNQLSKPKGCIDE